MVWGARGHIEAIWCGKQEAVHKDLVATGDVRGDGRLLWGARKLAHPVCRRLLLPSSLHHAHAMPGQHRHRGGQGSGHLLLPRGPWLLRHAWHGRRRLPRRQLLPRCSSLPLSLAIMALGQGEGQPLPLYCEGTPHSLSPWLLWHSWHGHRRCGPWERGKGGGRPESTATGGAGPAGQGRMVPGRAIRPLPPPARARTAGAALPALTWGEGAKGQGGGRPRVAFAPLFRLVFRRGFDPSMTFGPRIWTAGAGTRNKGKGCI